MTGKSQKNDFALGFLGKCLTPGTTHIAHATFLYIEKLNKHIKTGINATTPSSSPLQLNPLLFMLYLFLIVKNTGDA